MKALALAVAVIVLPGGVALVALITWWQRRVAARDAAILADLISPPVQTYGVLSAHEVNALRADASRRRAAAAYQHRKGTQIETGVPVEDRIRLVNGHL